MHHYLFIILMAFSVPGISARKLRDQYGALEKELREPSTYRHKHTGARGKLPLGSRSVGENREPLVLDKIRYSGRRRRPPGGKW